MPLDSTGAASGELPLVGRERARTLLDRWLDEALRGTPRIVVLAGPAGIGKTRLTDWLGAHATARGVAVHSGSGLAGTSVAYLSFRTAFAELRGSDGDAVGGLLEARRG